VFRENNQLRVILARINSDADKEKKRRRRTFPIYVTSMSWSLTYVMRCLRAIMRTESFYLTFCY